MIESGNLEGILLTGITEDGLTLLQNYVDRSGDVQTACMAGGRNDHAHDHFIETRVMSRPTFTFYTL
jgi:hypothetical protein